jgi:LPXTG-motif cell wall-anchored protein
VPKEGVTGMGNVTVKYYSDVACTDEVKNPKNVGTYYVGITVTEGDHYDAITSVLHDENWKFTIGKASATADSSNGSSDNTNTNTDTSEKIPYDDVAISTGSVNDITGTAAATAESNPFETKIENNNNLPNLLSLTDAEVAQGVNVWLDVQDMSSSVPQTDKTLIQNTSGDYTVGLYLDINLFKKVGGNDATKVTETNGKVKASIVIPESLRKSGRTFELIRVHNCVATAIAGTYDEKTHVFTFETDKFSTYALAYKDSAVAGGTTNSTLPTSPKTGDPSDASVWYLLLIVSLGGLGFLGYSKKKNVNY